MLRRLRKGNLEKRVRWGDNGKQGNKIEEKIKAELAQVDGAAKDILSTTSDFY